MLFDFLQHAGIPVAPDGRVLAYKGVTSDYKDVHSSHCVDRGCNHRTYDNCPGAKNEMPRAEVSDDPDVPCHAGFHVRSLKYARDFGPRVVVCAVELPSTLFEGPLPAPAGQAGDAQARPAYTAEGLMALPVADLRGIAAGIGIVGAQGRRGASSRAALVVEILRVTEDPQA